jgi:hypothetical protein
MPFIDSGNPNKVHMKYERGALTYGLRRNTTGDYSEDLLAVLRRHLADGNRTALSRLIWAIQWVPYRMFTPLLSELLDRHRYDGYMEAIADMLFDIRDERSVSSITRALDYHVRGDGSYNFNVKLICALERIGTEDAVEAIRQARRGGNEIISEAAEEALERLGHTDF